MVPTTYTLKEGSGVDKSIDILEHKTVPKHEVLTKKEKEVLLNSLGIIEKGLPKITSDDPAIGEMNTKSGDVIKITRKSETAGRVFYYRIVV